jgi:hypothetical protein
VARGLVALAAGLALAVAPGGCGSAVDRGEYVNANERLFKQLPTFPGARLSSESSDAYHDGEDGPVIGYDTRFDLKLPDRTDADAAASFFRGNLQPEWQLVEELDGPVLNFRMGQALVSINLENWHEHVLEVAVDHAYYGKLGR